MAYLCYAEYREMGGDLDPVAFSQEEFRARKVIDSLTDMRVSKMQERTGKVLESVKRCMLDLITINSKTGTVAQVENPTVTSFNTDGYSESYGNAYSASDSTAAQSQTACSYLYGEVDDLGVPLLYRGVR